ncbi:MAG: NUDIX domain-containing protein, partial [Bacteroidetes bacterium]|nr:NUDIX domain-containing protein [Bacteroidota bacterium]
HIKLINSILQKHSKVMVFLASNPAPSDRHPLEWILRAEMFESEFGDRVSVFEMPDLPDDRIWSQELDRRILEQRSEGAVTIYGSNENFVQRYSGKYTAEVLEAVESDFPEEMPMAEVEKMRDFRAGILYATLRRYPTVYPTVDIAVFRNDFREILLARKENETKFRFPGGFADPSDESFEMAAIRELMEECGDIDVVDLMYIGSCRIDDWRYRDSMDTIMTHLYVCMLEDGEPVASDDISELRWMETEKLSEDLFVYEHKPLFFLLKEYLEEML